MKLKNKGIPEAQNHGHEYQHPRYSSSHEETCTTWWQGAKGSGVRKEIYASFSVVFPGHVKWCGICEALDFELRCWDMVSIQWLSLNFSSIFEAFSFGFHWIAEFSMKISFLRTNISILIQGLLVSPVLKLCVSCFHTSQGGTNWNGKTESEECWDDTHSSSHHGASA